jgi:hypothetical protein
MASTSQPPCIYVLAGANGAGKSSLGGAALLQHGVEYFNPDEAARRILAANPTIIQEDANSAAWHEGKRLLERAITERLNFAFETTLGGNTIPALLERALESGIEVRVYDNSEEADPNTGALPEPILILHLDKGKVGNSCDLTTAPEWTKPILLAALKSSK